MTHDAVLATGLDPAEVAQALSRISDALVESYGKLARHAERVEGELVAANDALAAKVAELDRLSAHQQAILEALPCGVVVRDETGHVASTNAAARALLGDDRCAPCGDATRAVEAGTDGASTLLRDDACASTLLRDDACASALLLGESARGETRWCATALGERAIASRWSKIESGGSVEILDDRTQIERLEERLHALDKMAALGKVAGGIAHEIRNPLSAVRGFAELLRRELDEGSKAHRFASRVCDGCEEANQIITSIACFAAPERLALETCEPRTLADDAITAAARVLPSDSAVDRWRITRSIDAPAFVGDRVQLRTALRNLVANALQAQPQGGAVRVAVVREDSEIVLRVDDAGPGIPPELRRRVADPFFTTRPEGTGLGLALVHTIAELHGGRLSVSNRSSPLGGAEVEIRIPFLVPQGEKPRCPSNASSSSTTTP